MSEGRVVRRTITLDPRIERFINEMLAKAIKEGKWPRTFSGMVNFLLMWLITMVAVVPEIGELMDKHQDEIRERIEKAFEREIRVVDADEFRRLAELSELLAEEGGDNTQ